MFYFYPALRDYFFEMSFCNSIQLHWRRTLQRYLFIKLLSKRGYSRKAAKEQSRHPKSKLQIANSFVTISSPS